MALQRFTSAGRDGISGTAPRQNEFWPGGLKRSAQIQLWRLDAVATGVLSLIPSTGYNDSGTSNVLDCEGFENVIGYFDLRPNGATRTDIRLQLTNATNGTWYDYTRASGTGLVYRVPDDSSFNTSGTFWRTYEGLGARYARFRVRTAGGSAGSCVVNVQGYSLAGR